MFTQTHSGKGGSVYIITEKRNTGRCHGKVQPRKTHFQWPTPISVHVLWTSSSASDHTSVFYIVAWNYLIHLFTEQYGLDLSGKDTERRFFWKLENIRGSKEIDLFCFVFFQKSTLAPMFSIIFNHPARNQTITASIYKLIVKCPSFNLSKLWSHFLSGSKAGIRKVSRI